MPKNGRDDDDTVADATGIIKDDEALNQAAVKKKTGDPVIDTIIDIANDGDSEPYDRPDQIATVTPINKRKPRKK